MSTIENFTGEYGWLSNFWFCEVKLDGITYPSTEHAYQAAKTLDPEWRAFVLSAPTFRDAKHIGYKLPLRPRWDEIKLTVMEDLLRQKFAPGSDLATKLLATSGKALVEGNTWGDKFWGVCRGRGENHLGKLLMKIREELRGVVR